MKFLKNSSYDIVRLLVNQIGITIFALVLYLAVGRIQGESTSLVFNVLVSVFSILFYFSLLYIAAWEYGAKDRLRIDSGRMPYTWYKGAVMELFANGVNLLCIFACLILYGAMFFGAGEVCYNVAAVFNMILRLIASMYIGILSGIFSFMADAPGAVYYFVQSLGFLACVLCSVGVTHLGYYLGVKEVRIFSVRKTKK